MLHFVYLASRTLLVAKGPRFAAPCHRYKEKNDYGDYVERRECKPREPDAWNVNMVGAYTSRSLGRPTNATLRLDAPSVLSRRCPPLGDNGSGAIGSPHPPRRSSPSLRSGWRWCGPGLRPYRRRRSVGA